ncbi:MAG TPA: Wzz/FepE/Etk N-terminal domain-containing protein [Candidatus Dormibacteraeota bacterium]|nr:Wzz/FepE/Etk N-terminal domain-containing protein [Candidatus Dormibacteraeota bacterium]
MSGAGIFKSATTAILHRKVLIAAILVLFLAGGAVLVRVTPKTYEAEAQLYVSPGADQALQQADGLLSAYYVQQVTSQKVLQRSADTLGHGASPASLLPKIKVASLKGTTIISVKASDGSAADAAKLANVVATAVVDQNRADATGANQQSQQYLTNELNRLNAQIQQHQAAGASPEQQLSDHQQYDVIYQRLQDQNLQLAKKIDSITVLEQAIAPDRAVNPDLLRYLLVAGVAGLCIAVLVALLVERVDDRILDNDALAKAAGTSLVIAVPKSSVSLPLGPQEPFSLAYAHLSARYPNGRRFLIVAASHRESAEEVAEALAVAAKRSGSEAAVLQGSSMIQQQATYQGEQAPTHRPWRPGGGFEPEPEAETPSRKQPGLHMLTIASQLAPAPQLDELAEDRITFVAVPAPFLSPLAVTMADNVDGAIIVAVSRSTRATDVIRSAELLRKVGVEPLAGILVPKESAGTNKVSKEPAAATSAA